VALEGLNNLLLAGKRMAQDDENPYCILVENEGLIDTLEKLQLHGNEAVFKKAQDIMTNFFSLEEGQDFNLLLQSHVDSMHS
jgi:hypothetical protein